MHMKSIRQVRRRRSVISNVLKAYCLIELLKGFLLLKEKFWGSPTEHVLNNLHTESITHVMEGI